jgi:hypothetical protein
MAINTGAVTEGVTVEIGGGVKLGSNFNILKERTGLCSKEISGTIASEDGCFFFCDGVYRQTLNDSFYEFAGGKVPEGTLNQCELNARCKHDGIEIRPGDRVLGYQHPRHANCESIKTTLICDDNKASDNKINRDRFEDYPRSYCLPRDGTSIQTMETMRPGQ